jgi:hypothetical protein
VLPIANPDTTGLDIAGLDIAGLDIAAAAACGVTFGLAFVALRSLLLLVSLRAAGVGVDARSSARLFVEGVAVEAFTWPSKLWADGYRVARLPGPLASRLAALALFRLGTLGGSGLLLALLAAAGDGPVRVIAGTLAVGLLALLGVRLGRLGSAIAPPAASNASGPCRAGARPRVVRLARAVPGAVTLGLAGSLADAAALALVLVLAAGIDPMQVLPALQLVSMAGAASGLPLGLGVFDAGAVTVLTAAAEVPVPAALAAVAVYRLTGPGLTLVLGLCSLGPRLPQAVRAARAAVSGASGPDDPVTTPLGRVDGSDDTKLPRRAA